MNLAGTRYEIYRGREVNGKLLDLKMAGYAFLNEGRSYYVVKLFIFPHNTYYISKNRNSSSTYTIFAKVFEDEDGLHFQNPVGHARLMEGIKTHLLVSFPDLASNMFMSLFPTESRAASAA